MPCIYLYVREPHTYRAGRCVNVIVSCDDYTQCKLFKKWTHILYKPTEGCIYVFKSRWDSKNYLALSPNDKYVCAKLQCVDVYYNQHDPAKKPLVLVFHFRKGAENGDGDVTDRYYRMSCFDTDKGKCEGKRIEELCTYTTAESILCALLQENDKLDKVLTYDIMKRPTNTGAGNGGTNCTYNCNKISVTNDTSTNANGNGEPKVGAGFTRYKHTPTSTGGNSNGGNDNAGKPACIIYRCQTLMGGNGTQAQGEKELPGIQGQKYKCVIVYFGCKARRKGEGASTAGKSAGACPAPSTSGSEGTACKPGSSTCKTATCQAPADTTVCTTSSTTTASPQDVPLLLELLKNGTNSDTGANQPEYYAHLRSTNGAQETGGNSEGRYYWVQITGANSGNGAQNTLKDLLEDIGLHTKKQNGASHNGHETLQALLKQALNGNGDGSDGANGDLTDKLKQLKGDKLRKLLGQPVNGSPGENGRQNGQNTLLTLLLKRIEFNVTDSVVVLLNRRPNNAGHNGGHNGSASGQDGSYGDEDIQKAISGLEPNGRGTRINRLKLGNGAGGDGNGKPITVKCVTCSTGDQGSVCACLAKCLTKYGYCVIQHDFEKAVNGKLGDGCSAGLRLLIPARDNGLDNGGVGTNGPKYNELRLYPGDKQTDPAHLQYLYYTKGAGSEGSAACTAACTTSTTGHTCSKTQNAQICSRLYVVFYNGVGGTGGRTSGSAGTGDPRPLLLGYGGCWYRPKDKNGYFSAWVKVDLGDESAGTCTCSNGGSGGADVNCPKHEKLLCELTKVVGFLNQVNLFQHPKGTAGGEAGQTTCQPGQQGVTATCQAAPTSGQTTCQALTSGQTTVKCTYEVHQYMGKQVQVQVTCENVNGTQAPAQTAQTCSQSATTQSCYRKLTHRPAGMGDASSASNANTAFRLGDVVYRGNGCTAGQPQGTIKYYGNCSDSLDNGDHTSTHKWAPLTSVAVYYYNEDKGYCDPLLVELEFAKPGNGVQNGDNGDNEAKEYYKLIKINGDSGNRLVWEKDTDCAKDLVAKPECLTRYLDGIRYCLKQVVRIRLECKGTNGGQYALEGRNAKNGQGQFSPIKNGVPPTNGKIDVKVCECQCPALTARKYKCLKHGLTEALKSVHYQVAGLAFTLPGKNNGGTNGVVEIPLYSAAGSEEQGLGSSCPAVPGQPSVPAAPGTCPPAPEPVKPGQPITTLYNSCMGDVCFYFYGSGGGTSGSETGTTTDTVPLMLRYNGSFYRPESRDQYFTKWVPVTALCKTAGECKGGCACCCPGVGAAAPGTSCGTPVGSGDGADCGPDCPCCKELANELDGVNEALNRVDLDKSRLANNGGSSGAGTGYGLPEKNGCDKSGVVRGCTLADTVGNNRVCLTKQTPAGTDAKKAYVKVVHRTKNGFRIGCLTYCGKEITQDGVTPTALSNGQCDQLGSSVGVCSNGAAPVNGQGTTINVANGAKPNGNGHKNLVNENGWNTVVVYYSTSDKCYMLPQLIVLLRTDNPVNSAPVTGSNSGKKYGYYILATKNGAAGGGGGAGSTGYAYQWRLVNGSKSGETPVKLDDKTDFQLLNAAVILTEWTKDKSGGKYGDEQIKKAVESAIQNQSLKESPGYTGQVNRLKNRDITVKDETKDTVTCSGTSPGTCCCKCLDGTGFKVMSHNIDQLVNLNGPFKPPLCKINLIAGLKFLIPTGERGKYRRVTLNGDAAGAQNGSVKYHHPDNGDKICVYFYCSDPRPLLVCYNGWAYRAKDMAAYNEQKWLKSTDVTKCCCPGAQQPPPTPCQNGQCKLLEALVKVADFLNPVRLHITPQSGEVRRLVTDKSRYYYVHLFNGQGIRIGIEAQKADESFCYNGYTHTHSGVGCGGQGFRLGDIWHGKKCIKENGSTTKSSNGNGTCISASDVNDSKNHKASPEVVVFYYKGDKNHEHPLLVALRNPAWCFYYNTYFELTKKFDPGQQKKYTKNKNGNGIDLGNTSPDGELAQKLDSILFKISKKLQIVLSERPVATLYSSDPDSAKGYSSDQKALEDELKKRRSEKAKLLKEVAKEADELEKTSKTTATNALTAGKPLATRDSLMHHVTGSTTYKAQLSNGASSSTPSGPTTTQIPVEEVHCPGLQPGGYRCFKHELVNANHIESVGGLVLCLWVDKAGGKGASAQCQPCTESGGPGPGKEGLELCDGQTTSDGETGCKNGETGGKNGNKVELSYTTCKGNLYVFF